MKLLQIAKFDLTDGLHPNIRTLSKYFSFHPKFNEGFLFCPDLIEAVGP